jgi:plastocyanin
MAKKKRKPKQQPPAQDAQPDVSPEERAARREAQRQEWSQQKRAEERAASRSYTPILAAGGVIVTLAIIIPVVLLITSGGGDDASAPTATARPDPRLGGQAPVQTFAMSADDDGQNINPRFEPNNFVARTGEVFQIDVTNNGEVFHNVTIDGGDGKFGTDDDWSSVPLSFGAGETATVRAKLDEPGIYNFECNLHAGIQVGTITVIEGPSGTSATPTAGPSATPAP